VNGVVVGKRIPIGVAVNGLTVFLFAIWNMKNPEMEFSVLEVGAVATFVTAIMQVMVVNLLGVTRAKSDKE